MSGNKLNTLLDILNFSTGLLKDKGIKDARLNAELMLAEVLNCNRINLYLEFDKPLTYNEKEKFKKFLIRRIKQEPLQYILGRTEFYSYKIELSKGIFIPRPDTEILVENFLKYIIQKVPPYYILEVGTGSGCISVAVCKELEKLGKEYYYLCFDRSEKAVNTTLINLQNNNAKNFKVFKSDFINDFAIDKINAEHNRAFRYIIANPPYISFSEYKKLEMEVKDFEPADALTDKSDGLVFFRKFLDLYKKYSLDIFLEIAFNQKPDIIKLCNEKMIDSYEFFKDYGGHFRVLKLIQ